VKRPIIWEQVVEKVKTAILMQSGRGERSLEAKFEQSADDAFRIKTALFPLATVDVCFKETRLVSITFSYQRTDLSSTRTWKDYLEFDTDHNNNVQLYHRGEPISVDDAAMLILHPVRRDPSFSPPNSN
jgi:hypothetical protein